MREDDEEPRKCVSGEEMGEEENARPYISVVQEVARSSLRFFSAVGGCGQGQEADFQPNNEARQIVQIQLHRPIRPP